MVFPSFTASNNFSCKLGFSAEYREYVLIVQPLIL